jgi:hypothetical protein
MSTLMRWYYPRPPLATAFSPSRESIFPRKKRPCPDVKTPHLNGNPTLRSCYHSFPPPKVTKSPRRDAIFPGKDCLCPHGKLPYLTYRPNLRCCYRHLPPSNLTIEPLKNSKNHLKISSFHFISLTHSYLQLSLSLSQHPSNCLMNTP